MNIINWKIFILTFIPILVAMGPLGDVPIFISLTLGLNAKEKTRVVKDAVITSLLITIVFLFIGKGIFILLGISVSDFMVAGGLLLLIIAINILLGNERVKKASKREIGVVPLGTPLLAGPAVLTTTLILRDVYGIIPTIVSLVLCVAFTGVVFLKSKYIVEKLGKGGTKAIAKITALLLAAIAVMLIRKGAVEIITMVMGK